MAYDAEISSAHPALFVIAIDQSGSMGDEWLGKDGVSGKSKSEMVATCINDVLNELIDSCRSGKTVKPRIHISLIGYGSSVEAVFAGTLAGQEIVPADILMKASLTNMEEGPGTFYEASNERGGTSTREAFEQIYAMTSTWVNGNKSSFPPVIIHITDGEYTSGDPSDVAERIRNIETNDGKAILWNIHIPDNVTGISAGEIIMPEDISQVPNVGKARHLFEMSSILPTDSTEHMAGIKNGVRAFAYNASPSKFVKLLNVGTRQFR